MRRTITIASCLALLCLAALAFWIYVKRPWQGESPLPEGNNSNGQAINKPSGPTEKTTMPSPVFELPVEMAFVGDDQFCPCYGDLENNTLYRWKGVVLSREQIRQTPYAGGRISRIVLVDAKDFSVAPFEAPVKYLKANEGYRPGYLDTSIWTFYQWKGVVLSKQELLDKSQDGKSAILTPDDFPGHRIPQVMEIDMPAHLKDQPGLWKKRTP